MPSLIQAVALVSVGSNSNAGVDTCKAKDCNLLIIKGE